MEGTKLPRASLHGHLLLALASKNTMGTTEANFSKLTDLVVHSTWLQPPPPGMGPGSIYHCHLHRSTEAAYSGILGQKRALETREQSLVGKAERHNPLWLLALHLDGSRQILLYRANSTDCWCCRQHAQLQLLSPAPEILEEPSVRGQMSVARFPKIFLYLHHFKFQAFFFLVLIFLHHLIV